MPRKNTDLQDEILARLVCSDGFCKALGERPTSVRQLPLASEPDSISGRVSLSRPSVFRLAVGYEDGREEICILKLKSEQIIKKGIELINCDRSPEFQQKLEAARSILGYDGSHIRESRFYGNVASSLGVYLPSFIGSFYDAESGLYAILMREYGSDCAPNVKLLLDALDAITDFHAHYYNRRECVDSLNLNHHTTDVYREQKGILLGMLDRLEAENAATFSPEHRRLLYDFALHIEEHHASLPKHETLTHNDFTPRNIFWRKSGIMIYDWELACYQCPEHDLIEFLLFVMPHLSDGEIASLIEYFKEKLFTKCGICFDGETYGRILRFNLLEYCVNRLSLYSVCNKALHVDFIGELARGAERLLTLMNI